eukprot:g71659.t1
MSSLAYFFCFHRQVATHMFCLAVALACLISLDVTTATTIITGALTLLGFHQKCLEGEAERPPALDYPLAQLAKLIDKGEKTHRDTKH